MLIILGGLPGTGKSTIARQLAKRLKAIHLRIDSIEEELRASSCLVDDIGPAGYMAAYGVARDNLKLGHTVIADSVNPIEITRSAWRAQAAKTSTRHLEIEIICSNKEEHKKRVEERRAEFENKKASSTSTKSPRSANNNELNHVVMPTWQQVLDREYETWESDIKIDTHNQSVSEAVDSILQSIGKLGARL